MSTLETTTTQSRFSQAHWIQYASASNDVDHTEASQIDAQLVEVIPVEKLETAPEPKAKKKKRKAKRDILWSDFQESWRVDLPTDVSEEIRDFTKNPKKLGDIFVHHARVYILGDRYGVTRLMNVSFRKLHQTLVAYDVSGERVGEIVALLRFCYAELVPERLRQLVIHFSSCNVEILWKDEQFRELLEEYGSLSSALVGSMLLRLD